MKRYIKSSSSLITLKGKQGDYTTYLTVDMWYNDIKFEPKKYNADARVDSNGIYRGNIFDETGAPIGDYVSDDSILISKNFNVDWDI